jgi:hypothetical protein
VARLLLMTNVLPASLNLPCSKSSRWPADIEGWLDTRDWQVRPSITGTGAPMIAATAASDAAGGGPA